MEIVDILLEKGADDRFRGTKGRSVADVAEKNGAWRCCEEGETVGI